MTLRRRLARARDHVLSALRDDGLRQDEKLVFVAERALDVAGLGRKLGVDINYFFELRRAPAPLRGLRDLIVRRATVRDTAGIGAIDRTSPAQIAQRLARGDDCWVGELAGALLCMVWLHRGPAPFCEDEGPLGRWLIGADSVWSYHAVARTDARQSGAFVKVFQRALEDALAQPGVGRVVCRIKHTNLASRSLHERLGFRRLGRLISVRTPYARYLGWHKEGARGVRSVVGRDGAHCEIDFS